MRRVNLLHAHGSPTQYLYQSSKCRCVACRGQKAADHAAYSATHREETAARHAAYRITHREERAAYGAAYSITHREEKAACFAAYHAAHREQLNARKAAYYVAHHEQILARRRTRKYNLLPGEWDAMLAAQGDSCAICGETEPGGWGWQTDHDHNTGKVRGILCHHCNTGLGQFRDDPEHLTAAIEYLAVAT